MSKLIECCICKDQIEEERSNNAWPVKDGRCCDMCNGNRVIPARLAELRSEAQQAE